MLKLPGLQTDPAKDVDDAIAMIVLGSAVKTLWASRVVTTFIDETKAYKWAALLVKAAQKGRMDCDEAATMAGWVL